MGGNIMAPLLRQMPWFPFLKRLLLSKEKALLARHRNFFSIQQDKQKSLRIEHAHLLHAAKIDDAVPSWCGKRWMDPACTHIL